MPTIIQPEDQEHFAIVCRYLADDPLHVAIVCADSRKLLSYVRVLQCWLHERERLTVLNYDPDQFADLVTEATSRRYGKALTTLAENTLSGPRQRRATSFAHGSEQLLLVRNASAMPEHEFREMVKLAGEFLGAQLPIVALFDALDPQADQRKIQFLGSRMLRWDIDPDARLVRLSGMVRAACGRLRQISLPARALALSATGLLAALLMMEPVTPTLDAPLGQHTQSHRIIKAAAAPENIAPAVAVPLQTDEDNETEQTMQAAALDPALTALPQPRAAPSAAPLPSR